MRALLIVALFAAVALAYGDARSAVPESAARAALMTGAHETFADTFSHVEVRR